MSDEQKKSAPLHIDLPIIPRLGSILNTLLGDVHYSRDFEASVSAIQLCPPDSFDYLLRSAEYSMSMPAKPFITPWTLRALSSHDSYVSAGVRKYKPVDRKVRPVPSYMPNPSAQVFKPIVIDDPTPLPHHPPFRSSFKPSERLTQERLDKILLTVPPDFLSSQEIDLLVYVLDVSQNAIAFNDGERGVFSCTRRRFPDACLRTANTRERYDAQESSYFPARRCCPRSVRTFPSIAFGMRMGSCTQGVCSMTGIS